MDPRSFRYYGVEMGDARPVPPSSFGTVALVLVLALLAMGAAVLAGHAVATAAVPRSSASELSLNVPPSVWALLFLLPLVVGFVAYLLRLILLSSNGWPARVAASLALVVVASLLLFLLLPPTPWTQNSSVTVGGKGTTAPEGAGGNLTRGNGTAAGSGGGSGSGNGTGTGEGGGSGAGTGGGSGSGSGTGSGQGQGGTGGGTGSGGSGSGGSGGAGGSGSGGTSNGTGPGNETGGCGNGTGRHLTPAPPAGGLPVLSANCTLGGGGSGGNGGTGGEGAGGAAHNNSSAARPRGTTAAPILDFGVPNWVFLLVAVALAGVAGVLAIPGLLSRQRPRASLPTGGDETAPTVEGAGLAVHDARVALENGEDPRESIVRLYCRLLGRVAPTSDDLAAFTAGEIQRLRLAALPILPARAEAITRMFEEARYSTHPVGRPEALRYVETMRAVELDLGAVGAHG